MFQVIARPKLGILLNPEAGSYIAGVGIPSGETPIATRRERRRQPAHAHLSGGLAPKLLGIGHTRLRISPTNFPELSETAG